MHTLILAGGEGTRLWPLSRQDFPKQFLRFGDQGSLLQRSVARFLDAPFVETISVVTNRQYAPLVQQQLGKFDRDIHIIVEPARKNTAPAIAFALRHLQENLGIEDHASILVVPSDHLIEPQAAFSHHMERIAPLVQDRLVLFGIRPTKPETGYGYIQVGERRGDCLYQVRRFVEKPDSMRAEEYLASGDYYWNSGMLAFSVGTFWRLLETHAPEIATSRFEEMPSVSFDYAVLEKCEEAFVSPLAVSWSDVGCWDHVYEAMDKDEDGNAVHGRVVAVDTRGSLIIGGKRLISTIGVEDLLIVETEGAIFISKRGESQRVKTLVQELLSNSAL